jgi:hypothetical protein
MSWLEASPGSWLLMVTGVLLLGFVLLKLGRWYWSRRLHKWAADQGLKVISFRGAKFYEGPTAWRRSDSQHLFRVQVEDRTGERKNAWVLFGTYFGFTWGVPITDVIWDDKLG